MFVKEMNSVSLDVGCTARAPRPHPAWCLEDPWTWLWGLRSVLGKNARSFDIHQSDDGVDVYSWQRRETIAKLTLTPFLLQESRALSLAADCAYGSVHC